MLLICHTSNFPINAVKAANKNVDGKNSALSQSAQKLAIKNKLN